MCGRKSCRRHHSAVVATRTSIPRCSALGPVMAPFAIGLFVSASHPTVTSDARETDDQPTNWPGFLVGIIHKMRPQAATRFFGTPLSDSHRLHSHLLAWRTGFSPFSATDPIREKAPCPFWRWHYQGRVARSASSWAEASSNLCRCVASSRISSEFRRASRVPTCQTFSWPAARVARA